VRLTLRQLDIFAAVADAGSTTAAGERLALSQSATSGALNELERLLDTRLFDRVGKRLVLNDSGRALMPQARQLLEAAREIEQRFGVGRGAARTSARPIERLRIGASTTIGNYLLPSLIASYLQGFERDADEAPDVRVNVEVGNTSEVSAAVSRLEVDIGLIEGPCHLSELEARPWLEDPMVIVCSPDHALVRDEPGARIGVKLLRAQRWLLREEGSGTREAVEHALLPHLHQWSDPMQLGGTEALKQGAAQGLGLTCLSLCAVQDLVTLGRLVVLETTLPPLTRRFYLIRRRQKELSGSLRRFIAHCEEATGD
jgi:DNA-binding transcriptional LysR family regulator